MSEQDRVDTPEADDVEAHKKKMTDDPEGETQSDDFEAHKATGAAWQDSDAEENRSTSAWQESDSDSDDFEAHGRQKA